MENVINLCRKEVEKDNKKFPVYFAYRQELNTEGEYTDVITPSVNEKGEPVMKARPLKVALADKLRKELEADNNFPYRMILDSELKLDDGKDGYYLAIDKDKEKNVRKDKYGKRHVILVIRKPKSYEPLPREVITFDDVDSIE